MPGSADSTNSLEDHAGAMLTTELPHIHNEHVSDDDDDDGGVALPPNIADTLHNAPPLTADSEDIEMIDAHLTTVTASSSADGEGAVTEASIPPAYADALEDADVPTAILLHQLEQIQAAQFNNPGVGLTGHVGSIHYNNSIPPTLLYPPLSLGHGGGIETQGEAIANSSNGSVSVAAQGVQTAITNIPLHILELIEAGVDFGAGETTLLSSADLDFIDQVDVNHNDYTLGMYDFLWTWGHRSRVLRRKREKGPELGSLERQRRETPKEVRRCDLRGDQCDIQGMNWIDMEVTRQEAREARHSSYNNYQSLRSRPPYHVTSTKSTSPPALPNSDNFLKFRRMDLEPKPHLAHFQLRNLIACTSRSNVFYAGKNKVHYSNPLTGSKSRVVMDLTDPDVQPPSFNFNYGGIQISTVAAKHDILLAGGFNGEYSMIKLNSTVDSGRIEGLITEHPNSITNHISLSLSRSSGLPQAAFASNDSGIRVLDCTTNTFTASHTYSFPVNCTAISPDSRLRMVVGDTTFVHVCNAETGETLQKLGGHSDYGFACAWADNGWHVATGNQDMTVKIWDARMWTDRHGTAQPLTTIGSELAGVRNLQFSPVGSGKRILLACEASDFVDVIDAESFESKQVLDFFGEIGGACFTPDGQNIFVSNCDTERGGIIEFERTGEGARMGYRMGKKDIDEINREVQRRNTKAWLDGEEEMEQDFVPDSKSSRCDILAHLKAERQKSIPYQFTPRYDHTQKPIGDVEDICHIQHSPATRGLDRWADSNDTKSKGERTICEMEEFEKEQQLAYELSNTRSSGGHTSASSLPRLVTKPSTWPTEDWGIDDGYTSLQERMNQQARGYDWRQTDHQLFADSRTNNRTASWHRRKHLFESSNSHLGSFGELDIGL